MNNEHPINVISCDWFAYSCVTEWGKQEQLFKEFIGLDGNKKFLPSLVGKHFVYGSHDYEICEARECHPLFHCSVLVKDRDIEICHLHYGNKRKSQRPDCSTGQAKVVNALLYTAGWGNRFCQCLRVLGWRWYAVARVDICCDFISFVNGRSPSRFMRDYISDPTATRPSFIRRGSNKFRAIGQHTTSRVCVDTLSWGTRDSPVQVNMYNKAKELREVHSKPWIVEKWKQAGLIRELDEKVDVYRVELSIKPVSLALASKDRSQIWPFMLSSVSSPDTLVDTWQAMHRRYFCFYIQTDEDAHKHTPVKRLQPITLFPDDGYSQNIPVTLQRHRVGAGRAERLLYRKLRAIEYHSLDEDAARYSGALADRLLKYIPLDEPNVPQELMRQVVSQLYSHDTPMTPITKQAVDRQAERIAAVLLRGDEKGDMTGAALSVLADDVATVRSLIERSVGMLPDAAIDAAVDDDLDMSILAEYYSDVSPQEYDAATAPV